MTSVGYLQPSSSMDASKASGPRACRACAASKTRCIFDAETDATGGKCKRCTRLKKICTLQTPSMRPPKPAKFTRVAQLEQKLDGLVSLIKSSQTGIQDNGLLAAGDYANSAPSATTASQPVTPASSIMSDRERAAAFDSPGPADLTRNAKLAPNADALLDVFRSNMIDQFPFVVLPLDITVNDMSQSKPFLLKTIMMVASFRDGETQAALSKEIFESLAFQVVIQVEKTLDLLQGLLVMIAWYHFHIQTGRRLSSMLQLANGLVLDLGLYKGPGPSIVRWDQPQTGNRLRLFPEDIPKATERTLEEMRAYLGVVYLNSCIAVFVRGTEESKYHKYALECITTLENKAEYPSDQYLVHLMRLQHIAENIAQALPQEDLQNASMLSAPMSLCIKTLQTKLNNFRILLPMSLQQNPFLLMHYHSVLTYLTETALLIPLSSRQATLNACLTSTQSFLSCLFFIPLQEYYKLTYVTWAQLAHALVVLSKLSSFESEDWDTSHVRGVVDLSLVLDALIVRFETMQTVTLAMSGGKAKVGGNSLLERAIPAFRQYKERFEGKRDALMADMTITAQLGENMGSDHGGGATTDSGFVETANHSDGGVQNQVYAMGDVSEAVFGELDEAFWQEIMGDWEVSQGSQVPQSVGGGFGIS